MTGEAVLGVGMLLVIGVGVLAITAQEPRNCRPAGETHPVTSFILAGGAIAPYTFQQPVHKCSEKKEYQ